MWRKTYPCDWRTGAHCADPIRSDPLVATTGGGLQNTRAAAIRRPTLFRSSLSVVTKLLHADDYLSSSTAQMRDLDGWDPFFPDPSFQEEALFYSGLQRCNPYEHFRGGRSLCAWSPTHCQGERLVGGNLLKRFGASEA
jgi:hypothetical protein